MKRLAMQSVLCIPAGLAAHCARWRSFATGDPAAGEDNGPTYLKRSQPLEDSACTLDYIYADVTSHFFAGFPMSRVLT